MQKYDNLCMGCMCDNGGEDVCRLCGFDHSTPQPDGCLKLRAVLDNRYIIGRVLECGADGITYLAWDMEEDIQVRLREFMPQNYCVRGLDGSSVDVLLEKKNDFINKRDEFLDIARLLARMSELPALFPVTDIFEANGTAYYASENIKSITLKEFLLRNGGSLTWEQFKPLILPVINTLETLNDNGLLHLGISPETLVVGKDGVIRIVGFTVRGARNSRSTISSQIFPGFTPVEQYASEDTATESADVYGLAAAVFRTLVGQAPPEATERVTNDRMIIPARIVQTLPKNVLTALAGALAILPEDRTQTLGDFRSELCPGARNVSAVISGADSAQKESDQPATDGNKKYAIIAVTLTVIVVLLLAFGAYEFFLKDRLDRTIKVDSNVSTSSASVISYDEIGSAVIYLTVPDFTKYTYAQILNTPEFVQYYSFEIGQMSYNNDLEPGKVYAQDRKAGEKVERDSAGKIKVVLSISQGPSTVKIDSYVNKTYDEVYVSLLEQGFYYKNIRVEEKVDTSAKPSTDTQKIVVGTSPSAGSNVSKDSEIIIFVNGLKEQDVSSGTSSGNTSSGDTAN